MHSETSRNAKAISFVVGLVDGLKGITRSRGCIIVSVTTGTSKIIYAYPNVSPSARVLSGVPL